MTISSLYRRLLWLYPAEFRMQFSEEMQCVFEQRARDHFANRKSGGFPFLLIEFSSIVKGASGMWLKSILSKRHTPLSSSHAADPAEFTSGREEAARQRALAIQNMVTAIANHDFVAARRYSDEETRLKRALRRFESDTSEASREIA
jgi:hypothetical protein